LAAGGLVGCPHPRSAIAEPCRAGGVMASCQHPK
jgi:hypothetical protein